MSEFWASSLRLRLTSQRGVVHLETPRFQDPQVCRAPVPKFNLNNVTQGQGVSRNGQLLSVVPANEGILGHQVLESLHDLGRLGLLVVGEDAGDGDDGREDHTKVEIVIWGLFVG